MQIRHVIDEFQYLVVLLLSFPLPGPSLRPCLSCLLEMPRLNLLIDEATLLKTYKIGTLTPTYAPLIIYLEPSVRVDGKS